VHSSAAESLIKLILTRLAQEGDLEEEVSSSFIVRNWPPALPEWSTKAVRDTFFAAPQFPRLSKPDSLKRTIADGITRGLFGYAEKAPDGSYINLHFGEKTFESDVEISDEVFLLPKEVAEAIKGGVLPPKLTPTTEPTPPTGEKLTPTAAMPTILLPIEKLTWEGTVPPQKWMTFYTKVLSRFPIGEDMKLTVKVEVQPKDGMPKQKVDETRIALRDLGLSEEIHTKEKSKEKRED
jgi:hypothetical protein